MPHLRLMALPWVWCAARASRARNHLRRCPSRRRAPRRLQLRWRCARPRDSEFPEQPVVDYVLRPPRAAAAARSRPPAAREIPSRAGERTAIEAAIDAALDAWTDIAAGDFERAMLALHTKPREAP